MAMLGTNAPISQGERGTIVKKPPGGAGTVVMLNVVALLSLIFAIGAIVNAKSAIHEIDAGIAMLCFICAAGAAEIIRQLRAMRG